MGRGVRLCLKTYFEASTCHRTRAAFIAPILAAALAADEGVGTTFQTN